MKFQNQKNEYKYDVVFFGSLSSIHEGQAKLLKKIDDKYKLIIYSKDFVQFKEMGFKNVNNYVFKDQIPALVSNIKITLVLNSTCSAPYYWSDRIHIMLGSGAFCLTENIDGIADFYDNNKHHILFNNEGQLLDVINDWLIKDLERKEIRENAYHYAHKNHSYKMRVNTFLRYIS